jgi:outer membrane receptor protein involved in Fe transport
MWGGWRQECPPISRAGSAWRPRTSTTTAGDRGAGPWSGAVEDRRTLRMNVARLDLAHEAARVYTRFGVEARDVEAKYRYLSTVTYEPDFPIPGDPGSTVNRDITSEPDGHQLAAYLTSRVRITDRLSGEFGLRWDDQTYDDVGGPDQFAPRLNVLYEATPATRLRAAGPVLAGAGHQRVAGRGRRGHVLPGAARGSPHIRLRARLPA